MVEMVSIAQTLTNVWQMIMIVMPMQTAWTRLGLTIALVAADILEMEQSAQVFYQFIWSSFDKSLWKVEIVEYWTIPDFFKF